MTETIRDIRKLVAEQRPLIHCITHPISIHQCANTVLAVGARPIMAEHPKEVSEITQTAEALMLNLGNITDVRMESMRLAALTAKERRRPILLDAVGVACSKLRRDYACGLIQDAMPTVIKGNYSEIHALYHRDYRSSGVDADGALEEGTMDRTAVRLAQEHHTVILASGKVDIITDGIQLIHVKNGTPQLSAVTGTGCMLGALTAAYLAVNPGIAAAVTACAVLGICGQLGETACGSGSFMVNLMDALSTVKDTDLERLLDMEERNSENI